MKRRECCGKAWSNVSHPFGHKPMNLMDEGSCPCLQLTCATVSACAMQQQQRAEPGREFAYRIDGADKARRDELRLLCLSLLEFRLCALQEVQRRPASRSVDTVRTRYVQAASGIAARRSPRAALPDLSDASFAVCSDKYASGMEAGGDGRRAAETRRAS